MAWATPQLIAWIERIEARQARATLFDLLEIAGAVDTAGIEAAFLRIASNAHPDLHRHTLQPADAERLLRAYGKVAAAYDTLRDPKARDRYRKEVVDRGRPISQPPVIAGSQSIPVQRPNSPSPPPGVARARISTPMAVPRTTTTPPSMARTTTPPNVARTTSAPNVARTTAAPRMGSASGAPGSQSGVHRLPSSPERQPIIPEASPAARSAAASSSPSPSSPRAGSSTMRPAPSSPSASRPIPSPSRPSPTPTPNRSRGYDSRPPSAGVGPRAQIYFRKAQSCLTRGDLGGALFNLRLAAAADPTSALIRVALAEVQAEVMGGKKP